MLDFFRYSLALILIMAPLFWMARWGIKINTRLHKKDTEGKRDGKLVLLLILPLLIGFGLFWPAMWIGHQLLYKSNSFGDPNKM